MKTRMAVLLITLTTLAASAQEARRAALAREVDRYVAAVHSAAETFLNRELSASERLRAIEPHKVVYDPQQAEGFKRVVADPRETPEIRAAALHRIASHVSTDERLHSLILQWLGDPQAPRALRAEAFRTEASLSFMNMNVPEVYRKMLDDPEPAFRNFAFTKLVIHGDQRAQQRLIRGLENPDSAALPAPDAIAILSLAAKKEFQPVVFKVLLETKDPATRLEAIRALGGYAEARQTLVEISRDAREALEYREAALGSLYGGDRDNVVRYVLPILQDESAPPRLQAIGIQMTINERQSMHYRSKAKAADEYDRVVRRLAQDARDKELREVANMYLDAVKPRF